MATVRVYQKRQLRLDLLNFKQRQIYDLGNIGVAAVKRRLAAAQGPEDGSAKPLTVRYAKWKSRHGGSNRRNLTFTGNLLRNFQVRTVSDGRAKANLSTRKDRIKGRANQAIEPWMVFSPRNRQAVIEETRKTLAQLKSRLLIEKQLGGKQR
jgi:hypothetical protein